MPRLLGSGKPRRYKKGWRQDVRLPDGTRRSFYGTTAKSVRDEVDATVAKFRKGGIESSNPDMLLSELLAQWLTKITNTGTRHNYVPNVRNHILTFEGFKHERVVDITRGMVQEFVDALNAKGLSPQSVRNAHMVLHSALTYAISLQIITTNPAYSGRGKLIKLPRVEERAIRTLTDAEVERWFAAADKTPYGAVYRVMVPLGMRIGEALGLPWSNVHFDRGTVSITQQVNDKLEVRPCKWGSSRPDEIPLPDDTISALRAHQKAQAAHAAKAKIWSNGDGLVFTTVTGRPISASSFTKHSFYPLAEQLGLPYVRKHPGCKAKGRKGISAHRDCQAYLTLHSLGRHTGTTHLAEHLSQTMAMRVTGHKTERTFRRYSHPTKAATAQLRSVLNARYSPQPAARTKSAV